MNIREDLELKKSLYDFTQISFSYNTNHIEGSSLTEKETSDIYQSIKLNKPISNNNDIIETINHFHLFNYMLDNVDKKLTEKMIKDFHKILKSNTSDSEKDWFNVGDYKTKANYIGSDVKTTSPKLVPAQMQKLLEWYNEKKNPTFNDIVEFHVRFEKIHPFQDGNGRIGRLIMFKECLKNNITPFIILDKDKYFYYKGLKEYNTEKGYLIDTLLHEQDEYINMIKRYMK